MTITDARITPDLREATVFYTVYGDDDRPADSAAALESAKGVLRSQVGKQTGVRFTPTLTFVADPCPSRSARIDDLLAVARDADAGLAEGRQGATYAGEADPYQHEDDDEDETDDTGAVTEVDSASSAGQSSDS